MLAGSFLFSSCIGSFALSNKVLSWNQQIGNKFVNEIVFFGFWILPVYEITIKDDAGGDPLIVPDSIVALGMMPRETLNELIELNARAMGLIHDLFKQKGLDLWDIKIEWGRDAETGKLMLIDEVSANGCRAYDMSGKNKVAGSALSDCFRA